MMDMCQRVVMLMGVNRSGTNALFNSLAADTRYRAFNESDDDAIYFDWNLRPEREIRAILLGGGPVLLKPVNETDFREVMDVVREYYDYDVWIPWIYRDPVNVHASWWTKWQMPPLDGFIEMWSRRNRSILSALPEIGSKVAIVRYEDLVADRDVFDRLCAFFGIAGKYELREDTNAGRRALPDAVIEEIERRTAPLRAELDANRRFGPR